jgi:hypothetical protein
MKKKSATGQFLSIPGIKYIRTGILKIDTASALLHGWPLRPATLAQVSCPILLVHGCRARQRYARAGGAAPSSKRRPDSSRGTQARTDVGPSARIGCAMRRAGVRRLRNERREDGSEDYTIVHEAPPKDMLLDPASFGLELENTAERGHHTQLVWQAIDSGDVLGLECSLGELMTMSTGMLAHDDVGILPAVLNAIDVRDFTAFLRACDTGEVECVKLLRKAGCDVTAWDKIGRTGLGLAAARGHAAVVRSLLGPPRIDRRSPATPERRTTGSIDLRDGNDETPLMLACLEGRGATWSA